VGEKPQIQALQRTAPVLAMIPGVPERRSLDDVLPGTIVLFAALNIATGKVIGEVSTLTARRLPRLPLMIKSHVCSGNCRGDAWNAGCSAR
jgi:hypothetical protein